MLCALKNVPNVLVQKYMNIYFKLINIRGGMHLTRFLLTGTCGPNRWAPTALQNSRACGGLGGLPCGAPTPT